jgi:hypothetical protein
MPYSNGPIESDPRVVWLTVTFSCATAVALGNERRIAMTKARIPFITSHFDINFKVRLQSGLGLCRASASSIAGARLERLERLERFEPPER